MVFKLIKGFQGHHHSFCEKNFKDKKGKVERNEKDNLKILKEHYTTIFNRKVPTDMSVLDEIKPMHMVEELGKPEQKMK